MTASDIRIGAYYSNGHFGHHWGVRQVVKICAGAADGGDLVRYKVIIGADRRKEFVCEREVFAAWARYEVTRNESTWERVG